MKRSIEIQVEIAVLAKLPQLTDRVLRKLQRAGVLIMQREDSRNRTTVKGLIKVVRARNDEQ